VLRRSSSGEEQEREGRVVRQRLDDHGKQDKQAERGENQVSPT
jgi:hypothetical protein